MNIEMDKDNYSYAKYCLANAYRHMSWGPCGAGIKLSFLGSDLLAKK